VGRVLSGGVFCGLALTGGATGFETGADQRSFGLAVALGGGVLGRLFPADGGKGLGRCALSAGVFCCCVLTVGDGDPGFATGADHRSFALAVAAGEGVLGRCATFVGGVLRCGALAAGAGDPGLTTGADQRSFGFAAAAGGGALGRCAMFAGGAFRCGALAAGGEDPGLTTGADQEVLGFTLALVAGGLGVAGTPGEELA
jgi:hypothetical protein